MKLVKINDNQIRCTLTREDLASRELKISELAYGTEKAKTLFRDMMKQANFEFGFEAEDIPLMIEAIPLNTECIVLIITKVEDPEELDTRFSRFAPSVTEDNDGEDADFQYADSASNEILDLFRQMQTQQENAGTDGAEPEAAAEHRRIFRMSTLRQVMDAASVIAGSYHGSSTLYRESHSDGSTKGYLLLLAQGAESAASFDRFCNIISEYGTPLRPVSGDDAFLAEHYEALVSGNAVHALAGSVS